MARFYQPDIVTGLQLDEDESRHAVRVLRLAAGDSIEVVDGRGTLHICRITMAHPKRCAVEIVQALRPDSDNAPRLVLAVAPTKNLDRMEWLVEKVTELGVDRIVPLRCHNSERTSLKIERLRKIMVSAMKQSLRATLPQLEEVTPMSQLLAEPFAGCRYMAYCDAELPREQRRGFVGEYRSGEDAMIFIGPEGDFSPGEVSQALAAGVIPVTLGAHRLRTETAALYAVAAAHAVNQNNSKTIH